MSDDLRPPQPPTPTRLNRRVLVVAAVTLGVTLFATAYTLTHSGPGRRPAEPAPIPAPDRPAEPGFLDRPPASPRLDEERLRALLAQQELPPPPEPLSFEEADPFATTAVPPPPPPRDPRREALDRALLSPLQPASSRRAAGLATPQAYSGDRPGPAQGLAWDPSAAQDASASRAAFSPAAAQGSPSPFPPGSTSAADLPPLPGIADLRDLLAPPASAPAGPEDPHERFLADAARSRPSTLALANERPVSPFRLSAGTVLPAALLTAVRSDLPGSVVAQLTHDVYDPSQTHLLLPRGARLLGRYQSQVSAGQDRLLVVWDRILLPDGASLHLPALASASPGGEAGLPGDVNAHYGRLFGHALLLSLISAGVQLSQPQESTVAGQAPSARQIAAGALGQQLGTLAIETTRRNLDLRPTITLPAGLPFHVHLTGDLLLPGPYSS